MDLMCNNCKYRGETEIFLGTPVCNRDCPNCGCRTLHANPLPNLPLPGNSVYGSGKLAQG